MVGNFQGEGEAGKMQFGSGWWFNDQKDGMQRQMTQLAQLGLLSRFVGMLTDSRSFLSYTRHEYFRRILCQMIGRWVADGEAPADIALLGAMVKNICFDNAQQYFAIEL
ncbi:glucuronate isomerase family protein [Yersinia pestis PY-94]|nr:glucuronate isomerase [Yersinia pestis]EIQ94376.1 glucuronate isomerase family protein [Yersinia pestis PY-02]EIR23852.1 glucuronate isomerase family protein [Yersinia pestis PY-08]EIS36590.1 glucuronate isomerase family protein [Yersinia pestis PY-56]EIS50174.1 glucuronate isomerase family protein [Yersinia pestis PY-59]EIS60790.1 glucuronate isomerase family protein [Yersinia pestis PY-61]EIT21941.1 glucuronate isomerase family protein [Yersinia pestis PY-94]